MWELLKEVLWLVVLCIAGVAACCTYIVCLLIWKRNEIFQKSCKKTAKPTANTEEEILTIHID